MADVSAEIMERNNLNGDEVDWLILHQANLRIIDATANRMGLSKEKVMINMKSMGILHLELFLMYMGMGIQIKKRRQYYSCSIWRWLYMGECLFKMGILNIFILDCVIFILDLHII